MAFKVLVFSNVYSILHISHKSVSAFPFFSLFFDGVFLIHFFRFFFSFFFSFDFQHLS